MTLRKNTFIGAPLFAAALFALTACGGSGSETTDDASAAETPVETASEAAEDAASEASETAEAAAEEVSETADEAVADVEEAAEEATETAEEAAETATAEPDTKVSAEVVAQYEALTGDAANGRRVFTKCMSCHVVQEGQNRVGPSLYGIIGRPAGSIEGFKYSDANANSGIVWTEPTMFAYLENPQRFIPGTIMAFPGLPNPQERADVIAYVMQESGQ